MVIFSSFDHVWIHKPVSPISLRTTFSHFSHQLQNRTSKTSLWFGVKERPMITYQPYRGIYVICTSVTAVCYHFALKSNPLSGEFIYTVEKSKWYPFINWWYKTISSFDMKQSVVSIGSQYTMVWQALWQRWRKA